MNTTFSFQVRMLLCERCGAPIEAAMAGGASACRYCGVQNVIRGRDERPVFQNTGQPQLPEPERLNRLRMQDHQPLLPPPELQPLAPNGKLEAWKVQEAMQVWQSTRQALRANPNDYAGAERLLFLTQLLSGHLAEQNDVMRQRAMLESALEAFQLPRQRQVVLGYLSRAACRLGDLDAAEAWLRPCDARSDDLMMDSSFRFSRAYLETARGNPQGVIAVLGGAPNEVPIHDSMDMVTEVLRANAWERMGQVPTAVAQLQQRMSSGPVGKMGIEAVLRMHPTWNLCAQSFPLAANQQDVAGAALAASTGGGSVGWILIGSGAFVILIGFVTSIGGVISALSSRFFSIANLFGALIGTFITLLVGAGLIIGGVFLKRAGDRAKRIRLTGIRGTARVTSVTPTGMRVNGVPRLELALAVLIPGKPEYATSTKLILPGAERLLGQSVPVRVDPQDPNEVVLELQ